MVLEGDAKPLRPAARNEIYLIAREAISNALRHADATIIEVILEYAADSFRLTIRDNGRGFVESADGKRASHFGLAVMKERAERLDGTLKVSSGAGAGSEVALFLPGRAVFLNKPGTAEVAHD